MGVAMRNQESLRGGPVRRPRQHLAADLDDFEVTKPTSELVAAVKAGDMDEIERLILEVHRGE